MKKILLIAVLMVTSMFAITQAELKKNYELCLEFDGNVDPKNPQINFDDCDKWIDRFENPKKYVKKEIKKKVKKKTYHAKKHHKSNLSKKCEQTFPFAFYLDNNKDFVKIKEKDSFGNVITKKLNKSVYLFDKADKRIRRYELTKQLFVKENVNLKKRDFSNLALMAKQNNISFSINLAKGSGILAAGNFQIKTVDITGRRGNMTVTVSNEDVYQAFYNFEYSKQSLKTIISKRALVNSLLDQKKYVITVDSDFRRIPALIYFARHQDKQVSQFLYLILNQQYDKAVKYLMKDPKIKKRYNEYIDYYYANKKLGEQCFKPKY